MLVALKRSPWVLLVATLLAAAGTARLGWWQLDRAAEKRALQAALEAGERTSALDAAQLVAGPTPSLLHKRVRLRGRWLIDKTIYLDNRPLDGRVGFYVVTPLLIEDPAGRGQSVLVQRGWVPRDAMVRERLPAVETSAGTVELTGRVAIAPARLYQLGETGQGAIRQNLDPAAYARETGLALLPVAVWQTEAGDAADTLPRDWPAPDLGLSKHYGYAFQWFALCALILTLYVWFHVIRPLKQGRKPGQPDDSHGA